MAGTLAQIVSGFGSHTIPATISFSIEYQKGGVPSERLEWTDTDLKDMFSEEQRNGLERLLLRVPDNLKIWFPIPTGRWVQEYEKVTDTGTNYENGDSCRLVVYKTVPSR